MSDLIVLDISPNNGLSGDSIAISGINLGETLRVEFNGVPSEFTINSNTQITTVVPNGATSGKVTLVAPGRIVNSSYFQIVESNTSIIKPSKISLSSFSDTITVAEQSFPVNGYDANHYFFIQNLPCQPTGDLWINFGSPSRVGAGSICIAPGESFCMDGSALCGEQVYILGTVAGMQFTCKFR